jgi:hypothetical protein
MITAQNGSPQASASFALGAMCGTHLVTVFFTGTAPTAITAVLALSENGTVFGTAATHVFTATQLSEGAALFQANVEGLYAKVTITYTGGDATTLVSATMTSAARG